MAVLPAAWGLTHINMSGELGRKEKVNRNGDKGKEIEGKNRNKYWNLKWDYKKTKY